LRKRLRFDTKICWTGGMRVPPALLERLIDILPA
jgi:hypothetical protein